ncbi:MAG: MarR family transcriptional regulator [Anaerolineae bacterium]|nr:MarR family transcriptional regulator [Anaerolineae bacterium]
METKSNAANRIARQIFEIVPYVMRVMKSEMRHSTPLVMPGHMQLLGMLSHRSWTVTELADRHAVSAPTMSNTITTLEERGWVTRVRSEEDRRAVLIRLTKEGKSVLEATHNRAENLVAKLLEPLDADEQEILTEGLEILHRVFEAAMPAASGEDNASAECKPGKCPRHRC